MKKRILGVEDSPTQGEMLRYQLKGRGFDVLLVRNGREALQSLSSFLPDVVVTDILMPEMDGYELCRTMKNESRWRNIPVILVTGLSDPIEVVRALECGADGFVVKPFSMDTLANRLNQILSEAVGLAETSPSEKVELEFQGEHFKIDLSRRQILRLLLSTYETAVEKNDDLRRAQNQLRSLNEGLEESVRERTRELVQEVGDRRKAQEQLTEMNQALEKRAGQLRRLAFALTRTEQAERQRLAEVLHDHLQQLLVGAKMLVTTNKRRRDQEKLEEGLSRVEDLLGEAVAISRDLTVELCPPILREGGLAAGLEWLGRRMKEKYGLETALDLLPDFDSCAEEVTVFLFQASRELLFNIFKHAEVMEAELSLSGESNGEHVRLTVRDRGKGFELNHDEVAGSDSFGLFSLGERAEAIGGYLKIESKPGLGTEVSLVVPCQSATDAVVTVRENGSTGVP